MLTKTKIFKNKYSKALISLLLIFSISLLPITASAIEYRGIGGQPANPRPDNPRTNSIFIYTLKRGESVADGIIVRNGTDQQNTILVYPTDSLVSSGGAFACRQKAEEARQVGSWIKMEKNEVTLPPQGSQVINFTINVPDAVDVGEHNGCIAIQSGTALPEKDVNGLALSFRSAIRVAITVPGKINKALDVTELKTQKAATSDKQGVKTAFRNRGNVSLDTDVSVKISGPFGKQIDKIDGTYAMLSGVSTELNFELKRPKIPWLYTVSVTGKYNDDPSKPLGQQVDKNKEVVRSISVIIWPSLKQSLIMLAVLAILGATVLRFVYKRYLLKRNQKSSRRYVVKKGDSVESIAKHMDVSWYDIALLNNLKAPYRLKPNSKIYIPTRAKLRETPKKLKKRK